MPIQNSQDLELAKFFTDVEPLRDWFDKAIVADTLPKRLLVIHGVGGIGKSSLLRMFRSNCKTARVPVALASGDEEKSAVDVLTRWADDLSSDAVNLPTFSKTLEHYRAIQAKVETKTNEARKKLGDVAGKAASKTAEAAGGAALGAALGSVIPGIGTAAGAALGGVIGGMGAEALVDYLRGFLTKPDIDLLLDPSKKLTEDFLADVNQVATNRRVVLMLDTYEQMTALDDWTREAAQRLNENILLVIAGRAMVNWGRQWSSWLMHAEVQELKPMTKRVMHELIRKYYATMRGGEPNPKQVNAIIEFSRGLPVIINTAVHLWVQYDDDFENFKPKLIQDLVIRLREGVPPELHPLLDAAATLRYFNTEILREVSGQNDITTAFQELRRFPFVRVRAEGFALHDAVRDILGENIRIDEPTRYRNLHERAAAYFEARMANAKGEDGERLGLERLYHRVCADEESGMELFQEMAEELSRYRLVNRLHELLNDANYYQLKNANSKLWLKYYRARLAHLELRFADAERLYQEVGENNLAERRLRAYACCDWGEFLSRYERLGKEGGVEKAVQILLQSLELSALDFHLTETFLRLARVARYQGHWNEEVKYLEQVRHYFEQIGDNYGLVIVYSHMKRANGLHGNWKNFAEAHESGMMALGRITTQPIALKGMLLGRGAAPWTLTGRFAECENNARESLFITRDLKDDFASLHNLGDLGWILGVQGKYEESEQCFIESLGMMSRLGSEPLIEQGSKLGFRGHILSRRGHYELSENYLTQSLNIKEMLRDTPGLLEPLCWLGVLAETQLDFESARNYYRRCGEWKWYERYYFDCAALTGLTRVHHAQQNYAAIPPLLAEAEQLAQQYEYNDHLASLRLTQGHLVSTNPAMNTSPRINEFEETLHYYQHALIYALRYNRFLLDEVLSGRPQGTPLRPIIPECLKRGEEGREMLLALRAWWQTGRNDVGAPRPDTISPIPENILLLEAEKVAREREPGDNSPQKSVLQQLDLALQETGND